LKLSELFSGEVGIWVTKKEICQVFNSVNDVGL
jgi:hypothetical protein